MGEDCKGKNSNSLQAHIKVTKPHVGFVISKIR